MTVHAMKGAAGPTPGQHAMQLRDAASKAAHDALSHAIGGAAVLKIEIDSLMGLSDLHPGMVAELKRLSEEIGKRLNSIEALQGRT